MQIYHYRAYVCTSYIHCPGCAILVKLWCFGNFPVDQEIGWIANVFCFFLLYKSGHPCKEITAARLQI